MITGYKSETQQKNIAWFLPRPKPDYYPGGMPLYAEEWILDLAKEILSNPDATILNVFCGMNKYGKRADVNPVVKPDYLCDIHELSKYCHEKFDIILADPPYSNELSKRIYNTGKLNYKKWTKECERCLNENGLLIVYHTHVMPNPDSNIFRIAKRVFIGNRPWHLPRVAIYFQKVKTG